MKIQLISPLNIKKNQQFSSNSITNLMDTSSIAPKNNDNISQIFYKPISFGCGKSSELREKLLNLKNVHCPCCGFEMLQQDKIDELLVAAKDIKTSQEFLQYCKEHKENISYIFYPMFENLEKITEQNPETELLHLLNIARSASAKHVLNAINRNIEYVKNIANNDDLIEHDKNLLIECQRKLQELCNGEKRLIPLETFANALRSTILRMNTVKKYEIQNQLWNRTARAFLRRNALYMSAYEFEKENLSPAYPIIKNMLELSTPVVRNITKYSQDNPLDKFNEIMLCKKCNKDGAFNHKLTPANDKYVNEFNTYLRDIAQNILQGGFEGYEKYPLFLRKFFKAYSDSNTDYLCTDEAFQLKQIVFHNDQELNSELPFIDDVPCACCGKDTISHPQKLALFEEIKNAKNNKELLAVIEKNKEIIRPKFENIVKDYREKIKENPKISDEELLRFLRERAARRLENKIFDCLEKSREFLSHERVSDSDMEKFEEFCRLITERYKNIDPNKDFVFVEYNRILDRTVGQMDFDKKHRIIFRMKKPIKKRSTPYQVLFPLPKTLEMFDSPMKVIIQDIFKNSCQTKDHLIARQKGGSDKPKNLLILCKDCNKDKTNSNFSDWQNYNPELKINMPKHFKFLKEKLKTGELDSKFEDYIKEVIQNIEELSLGAIKINLDD